jgi:hypothetical protein
VIEQQTCWQILSGRKEGKEGRKARMKRFCSK